MSSLYKTLTPLGEIVYGEGAAERDLTAEQERDALDGGHLELVPRKYKVTSHRYAGGTLGDVVTLALRVEPERMLIEGGHLERVEDKPKPKAKPKPPTD